MKAKKTLKNLQDVCLLYSSLSLKKMQQGGTKGKMKCSWKNKMKLKDKKRGTGSKIEVGENMNGEGRAL